MSEIKRGNIRLWSNIGARATFGQAILEMARERDDFYVMSADLCQSSGLVRFRDEFPDRFINSGIAEQNLLGLAAGMAKDGTNIFATSFSPFITMRACEQVRMNMGYMQLNVKTVGLGAGLALGELGNSHYGIEDSAIMRAIPGMTVINPSDGVSIFKAVEALTKFKGPAYLRLTGGPGLPIVYNSDIDFTIGKAINVREGEDVAIIAIGTMVYQAKKAADQLANVGINAAVFDMHTVKPIDCECIDSCLRKKLIVTVEEASVIGGLGGAVAEYLSCIDSKPRHLILGINDEFPHAGSYSYLLEKTELSAEWIAQKIIKEYC